jgi:tripartite-type tricarboxylate transporter receptor subunit TctC
MALACAFTITNLVANPGDAAAQAYPAHLIKIVVPVTAGGPGDTITRIVAAGMSTSLGQPVIIENIPGASGTVGVGRVARAMPDGYTLCFESMAWSVFNGAIFKLSYDLTKDLDPVSLIVEDPMVLVGRKTIPAKSLTELIAWLKANPDKALAGTGGAGSVGHIFGINFQKATGTSFRFVPFHGFAEAGNELLAGRIDLIVGPVATFLPLARAGRINAYAVFDKTRLPTAPELPTADEAGASGLFMSSWFGFFVPHGTPKTAVEKLNAATVYALSEPLVRQRLAGIGQRFFGSDELTPESLRAYQHAAILKWWPIIRSASIKPE